jgi:hypothetical protein
VKAALLFVFSCVAVLSEPLPPMASTQRLLFENSLVRVTELNMKPGAMEPEHQHARGVTVALTEYDNEVTNLPGRGVTRRHTAFGETRWAEPSRHETRNTGQTQQRVIRVELKGDPGATVAPSADPLDSLVACKDTQKLIFENSFVRVIEEHVPPGVAQPKHRHRKGVLIPLADAQLESIEDPGTTMVQRQLRFGDAGWREPTVHQVKNAGTTDLRNIRVEIK